MSTNPTIRFLPDGLAVSGERSETILDVAEAHGLAFEALCRGNGVCGTCTVRVESGADTLSPVGEEERSVLTEAQLEAGYRLGCRAALGDGEVTVFVPPGSRLESGIVMTEGRSIEFEHDPAVKLYPLQISAPTLDDTVADRERLLAALEADYGLSVEHFDRLALAELPNTMRTASATETLECTAAGYREQSVLACFPGRHETAYGVAVDVGTTTLAVYLLDLRTGDRVAVTSMLNPQRAHGGDIVSRVAFTQNDPAGRRQLQQLIRTAVNEMIDEVSRTAEIEPTDVLDAVFVGNTAMHHLFLGIEPRPVAASPYVPANHALLEYTARDLDIEINPSATVSWLPVIGGWVGPDFVACLLAADVLDRSEPTVYIDIGTNGEIAVSDGERVLAASAPAGPALEGAEITQGVQAKPGAIERVQLDSETWEPAIGLIGEGPAIGICGSGILDVVAQLFLVGAIDRRGLLAGPDEHERIREDAHGNREFLLVPAEETDIEDDIVVSQADIREIQHAKAAIQTGVLVLLDRADVGSVEQLVMAGGFGNAIEPESARLLGMYPETRIESVEFLGNAAGYGAMYALLDTQARERAAAIVEAVEYVELAAVEGFQDEFMEAMFLPHHDLDRYPRVREEIEAVRGPLEDV